MEDIARGSTHPVVLCTGARGSLTQVFVALEGQVTMCPSLLAAVDRAFKVHYLFNIAYISAAEHVWQLLQKATYGVHDKSATFASVTELMTFIKSKP